MRFLVVFLFSLSPLQAQLRVGLDVLSDSDFAFLRHKRLALICNASSVSSEGAGIVDLFLKHRLDLRVIFAPEHGFALQAEAGKLVSNERTASGVQIISLYGKNKKPTAAALSAIDAVVFDLQDIGARCYTFISTMKLAMQAAAESQKEFIALDRPNPLAPIQPDGFMLDTAYSSFVGLVRVPFIHSLTIGEIAALIQREELPSLRLSIVKLRGYSRLQFLDEMRDSLAPFLPPSPNIQTLNAALLYPATVLLEGANVSEGRGTDFPFEQIGAPFIDSEKLKSELGVCDGVRIESVSFTPKSQEGKSQSPKFENQLCNGIRFFIVDRKKIKPFEIAVRLLCALQLAYPTKLEWESDFFDKLAGTNRLRLMIQSGASVSEILDAARQSRAGFVAAQLYLYP
jgi:uncharacterized protein YbbC (DUF1343 family)